MKPSILRFRKKYFTLFLVLFTIEVLIALFAHDRIIRPYIGDLLVVILIYSFVRSFLNVPVWASAIAVLLFSYTVEFLQYFDIVDRLGFQHSPLARIIIGTSFQWLDLVAYSAGTALILYAEKLIAKRIQTNKNKRNENL